MGDLHTQANVGAAGGFILARLRVGVEPAGAVNGVNLVYTTPEDFLNTADLTVAVYWNGLRLFEGAVCDYTISESGGIGTGFDTITFAVAPKTGDNVLVDYVTAP